MTQEEFKRTIDGLGPRPGMEYRVRRAVLEGKKEKARPRVRRLQGGVIAACCCVLLAVVVGISNWSGSPLQGFLQTVRQVTGIGAELRVEIQEPGNRFIATCPGADQIRVAATGGSLQPPYMEVYAYNCLDQTVNSGDPFEWTPEKVADGEETILSFTPLQDSRVSGKTQYVRVVYHAGEPAAYDAELLEEWTQSPVARIYAAQNFQAGAVQADIRDSQAIDDLRKKLWDGERMEGRLDVPSPDYIFRGFESYLLPAYEELYLWENDNGTLMMMSTNEYGTGYRVKGIDAQGLKALFNPSGAAGPSFNPDDDVVITTPQPIYPLDSKEIPITLANRTDKDITYGESFQLYQRIGSDWIQVQFDANWRELGYMLQPSQSMEETIPLNYLEFKQPLTPGRYCFVRSFFSNGEEKEYAVQFSLGTGSGYDKSSYPYTDDSGRELLLQQQEGPYSVRADQLKVAIANRTDTEYVLGDSFTLEKQIDGEWYEVPVRENRNNFTTIAYSLAPGARMEKAYSLKDRYDHPLTAGSYRLVIPATYDRTGGENVPSDTYHEDEGGGSVSHTMSGSVTLPYSVEFQLSAHD